MTEHGKARRNRQRDLDSFHQFFHRYDADGIAAGITVVNVAPRFRPKFPIPQEGMALISLARASLGVRMFWLQGEGDSEQIEGALLQRGGRGEFVELDRRI
jgi:hypothetical protein